MFRRYFGVPKDANFDEDFMSRFPILFQERKQSMNQTCMCWGIDCPEGWYHIIEQLCTALEFYNIDIGSKYGLAIVAEQVKEKFGTLRFYYTVREVDKDGNAMDYCELSADDNKCRAVIDYLGMLASNAIDEACAMTLDTCAKCGCPLNDKNKVVTRGYISYMCDKCATPPKDNGIG